MAVYLVVNWSSLFTAVKHLFGEKQRKLAITFEYNSHSECLNYCYYWTLNLFFSSNGKCVCGGVCDCCLVGQLLDHFKLKSKCIDRPWFALRTHILAVTTESGNAKQSSVDPMGVGAKLPAFNDTSTEIRIDFLRISHLLKHIRVILLPPPLYNQ